MSIEVYGTVCQLCGIRGIIPVCNFLVFISSSGLIFRIPAIQNIDYSVNFFCTAYLSFCCFDNRIASFIVFRINLCVVRLTRVFYPEFCGKYTFTFYTQRTVYVIWICSPLSREILRGVNVISRISSLLRSLRAIPVSLLIAVL